MLSNRLLDSKDVLAKKGFKKGHNDQKERDCGFLTLIDPAVSESESVDWIYINRKRKKMCCQNIDIKDKLFD